MLAVVLQHTQMLCESVTKVESDSDVGYNGEGNGPARVKDTNIWDEEW